MGLKFTAFLLFALMSAGASRADEPLFERTTYDYELTADYTGNVTITDDLTIRDVDDVEDGASYAYTFNPALSSLELVEAWVEKPNGARLVIGSDAMMLRPSEATRDAPGFVSTQTATILFPQVEIGARRHFKLRETAHKPEPMGLNQWLRVDIYKPSDLHVTVTIPEGTPLAIGHLNDVEITDRTEDGVRRIEAQAHTRGGKPQDAEAHTPSIDMLSPVFVISAITSTEEIGRRYYLAGTGKTAVTPEIQAQATRIVGDRHGLDAARAIHDWVALNIRYIALWLQDGDNWTPHDAASVLKNGYGDCKDHVALMQALLAAEGIASEPVLINSHEGLDYDPIPSAFTFNHTIIYLPAFDLYDNPTDSFAPFGVLNENLAGKLVVHASETPRVAHTPDLAPKQAAVVTRSNIVLGADGSLKGDAKVNLSPVLESQFRYQFSNEQARRETVKNLMGAMQQGGTGTMTVSDARDLDTPFQIAMTWQTSRGFQPRNGHLVVPAPPLLDPIDSPQSYLSGDRLRRFPVFVPARDLTWETTIKLPAARPIQDLPAPTKIANSVGSYTADYQQKDGQIIVRRHLVLRKAILPAAQYLQVEEIAQAVMDDFTGTITLEKDEN